MSEAAVSAAPTALYLYGVVPAGTELGLSGAGVDSSDVGVLTEGELGAIVGLVPLEKFGEEPLRRNLKDRDWMERTARAHETVLERALGTTTVIPFRIATLYGAEPDLREFLITNRDSLLELLEQFNGKVELGVKAYFGRAARNDASDAASGSESLRRPQAEQTAMREADAFALDCARTSHEHLATAALDSRSNRPQASDLSGRSEQMLLDGAYLIERSDSRLEQAVRELEEHFGPQGVTYELTGPRPPYNFVPRHLGGR